MRNPEMIDFDLLVSAYCDGALDEESTVSLEQFLRDSPVHRQRFLELTALHGSLAWVCKSLEEPPQPSATTKRQTETSMDRPRGFRVRFAVVMALAACVLIGIALSLLQKPSPPEAAGKEYAVIEELSGQATLSREGGISEPLVLGQKLQEGQTVRVDGEDGFAVVSLSNGGKLELSGVTTVRLASLQSRAGESVSRTFVSQGVVRTKGWKISQQGCLETPHAKVEITDAVLTCSVGSEATRIESEQGQAHIVRLADNKPMTLDSGSYAIASTDVADEITVRPLLRKTAIPRAQVRLAGSALALSPDGQLFATAARNKISFWNTQNGLEAFSLSVGDQHPGWLAFSPQGNLVATSGGIQGIQTWNLENRTKLPIRCGESNLSKPTFSPDGKWLAGIEERIQEKTHWVRIFDHQTGKLVSSFSNPRSITSLAFSPDSSSLVIGTGDGQIVFWDLATGRESQPPLSVPRKERISLLTFTPDGERLVSVHFGTRIKIWDLKNRQVSQEIPGLGRVFRSMAVSPDGQFLALGSHDGTFWLWNLKTRTEWLSQHLDNRPIVSVGFFADQLTTVSASGYIQQWNLLELRGDQ